MTEKIEFTITFWIKADENPGWNSEDTDVRFPPFTVQKGIKVFTVKYGRKFKVYILHPQFGYRKVTADIHEYIGKNAFIAITVDGKISKLYLNAKLISTLSVDEMISELEQGDFILVRVQSEDLKNIRIAEGVQVVMPAEVKAIESTKLRLFFFDINEIAELPRDRIV